MDEAEVRTRKIEMDQERMEYIDLAYNEETTYWKRAALTRVLNEKEEKELADLAPSRVLLICKEKIEKTVNIDEMIFYLKSMFSTYNEEPINFIHGIATDEPSLEAMSNHLKTFPKCIKHGENMSLKNKCLFGEWILMASKLYRKENLPYRFEDWLYCLWKVKRQASYNYRNFFRLMSATPKQINCKINATYFVKNHEILLNYFNESETQLPWNHMFSCRCEDCILYFGEAATT